MPVKQEIKDEPRDEEMPFPTTASEDELSDDQQVFAHQKQRMAEIDNALNPSPQKRGRKVGSGAGEKRKAADDYSTNPHTKRARTRAQNMSAAEAELARVKSNTASAKSKARKKLRQNTPNWDTLPLGVQEKLIFDCEAAVDARQNELGYTVKHVRSQLENERLKLEEELSYRERADVNALCKKFGIVKVDDEDERFWEFDDDEEDSPENDMSRGQVKAEGNTGDIVGGYMAGLEDWKEATMTSDELAEFRAQHRRSMRDIVQQTGWDMFQQSLIDQLCGLVIKEDDLRRWNGSEHGYNMLKSDNRHTPDRYFTTKEKALLRFGMAMSTLDDSKDNESEWIDLPGPTWWWPTVTGKLGDEKSDQKANKWYLQKGFEFSEADMRGYRFAADAIRMKEYPLNWTQNLVHKDSELVWDSFRD